MNTYIDIQFKGLGFSPKKLKDLTDLPIEILVESGEIGKIGKYKGKQSPYGVGLLKVEPSQDDEHLIRYCKILNKHKQALKLAKVKEIIFDIETSLKSESSFSISSEVAKLIGSLNARLMFNQVEKDANLQVLINLLNPNPSLKASNKFKLLQSIIKENHLENKTITAELFVDLAKNLFKSTKLQNTPPSQKIEVFID